MDKMHKQYRCDYNKDRAMIKWVSVGRVDKHATPIGHTSRMGNARQGAGLEAMLQDLSLKNVEPHANPESLSKDAVYDQGVAMFVEDIKKGCLDVELGRQYPRVCRRAGDFFDVLAEHCTSEQALRSALDHCSGAVADVENNTWDAVLQAMLYDNTAMLAVIKERWWWKLECAALKELAVQHLARWCRNERAIKQVLEVVDLSHRQWHARLHAAAGAHMNDALAAVLLKRSGGMC